MILFYKNIKITISQNLSKSQQFSYYFITTFFFQFSIFIVKDWTFKTKYIKFNSYFHCIILSR